ncbi:larval cuticle protein 65Ag1-like isoform X11 [Daphnia pulicaria]|uniref:larval cuticle protein 65Ag1-like isoform X2 n=1 Tax=Daphnia pulicaria TaxID=35523 RepID=UPI001EEAAA4A|nr:larval cuticle protein 65Ag1-like isoform X2 [Daphnia pulicaria]XP_046636148.1 larval cuticle protein 65Ag1-like isoform X11 [Daphnia pulicaria]
MKLFVIAALLAVAAAAPSSYDKEYKAPEITIVSQSDVRNLDGSGAWSYAGSDGTTRDESYAQKKFIVTKYDDYGKEYKEEVFGHTSKGSSYWISPEGERLTLTWVADDAGFQPKGDHLPVAPVHVYELPVAPVHEYELPVAPVHIPFNGKGYKIF